MGIGTLRRYHEQPVTKAGDAGDSTPAEEAAQPADLDALEAAVKTALAKLDTAREASTQALDAAHADPFSDELTAAATKAEDAAQEAQRELEAAQLELDEAKLPAEITDHKHGDLDRPLRAGSTDVWIAYAKADPSGAPFDLTKRTGLRDDIAAHYLGTPE